MLPVWDRLSISVQNSRLSASNFGSDADIVQFSHVAPIRRAPVRLALQLVRAADAFLLRMQISHGRKARMAAMSRLGKGRRG